MNTRTSIPSDGLSVIIIVHNQAAEIERNLPRFLAATGEVDYEVIVVDDASDDATPDVLQRMKTEHAKLYTTFLPKSVVFNPSRMQLALSIGMKATHYSYIMVGNIEQPPVMEDYISELYSLTESGSHEVVLTYSGRREGDPVTFQTWDTLEDAAPLIRKAERRTKNRHNGQWLKFRTGKYDAVTVKRQRSLDMIKLFDMKVSRSSLWGLQLEVLWKNLMNR